MPEDEHAYHHESFKLKQRRLRDLITSAQSVIRDALQICFMSIGQRHSIAAPTLRNAFEAARAIEEVSFPIELRRTVPVWCTVFGQDVPRWGLHEVISGTSRLLFQVFSKDNTTLIGSHQASFEGVKRALTRSEPLSTCQSSLYDTSQEDTTLLSLDFSSHVTRPHYD